MTDKVNGGVRGGEFLTGKMDFFTIQTLVPVKQTNVETPVADLYQISANVWTPVTVVDGDGVAVTYATQNDYVAAYQKQKNLDTFLKVFGIRANPVAISIATASETVTGDFGSDYSGSMTVATINIATEKSGLWYAAGQGNFGTPADETNEFGYMLADALAGVEIYDVGGVLSNTTISVSGADENTKVARRVML